MNGGSRETLTNGGVGIARAGGVGASPAGGQRAGAGAGTTAAKAPVLSPADMALRAETRYIERVRTICGILNIGAAQVGVLWVFCVCVCVLALSCIH